MTPEDILRFWFEEINPAQRFKKDPKFDQLLREKFLSIHEEILDGKKEDWKEMASGVLAYIIVIDQFSRNMFRDKPESFAYDEIALKATLEGIEKKFDQSIPLDRRSFFYMPIMHSEDPKVHEGGLPFFELLPGGTLGYELKHKKIIDRFGRYPHRNEILGRTSTPEELDFLQEANSSF